MHYQYWPLQVTAPAGTPITAPVTTPWPIVQGLLKRIEVDIPPGGSGTVGIRVVYKGTVIYPWSLGGWLIPVLPGYVAEWDDEIMATGLQVQMYNTGAFPHTTYWRAEVWPVTPALAGQIMGGALVAAPPGAVLAGVGGLSGGGP